MLPEEILQLIFKFIPYKSKHEQIINLCKLRISHHTDKIIQYILNNTYYTKRTLKTIKKKYTPKFPQFYIWIKVFETISKKAKLRYNYLNWKRRAQYLYIPPIQCSWKKNNRCIRRCELGNRLCYIHKTTSLTSILIHFNCERI